MVRKIEMISEEVLVEGLSNGIYKDLRQQCVVADSRILMQAKGIDSKIYWAIVDPTQYQIPQSIN